MKKSILEFGIPLSKDQQRKITGGDIITALRCDWDREICWQEQIDTETTATFTVVGRDGTEYIYIL